MEYIVISEKSELLSYRFLSEEVLYQIEKYEAIAVWSYDETVPICCAIFTHKDIRYHDAAILQYIGTDVPYRRQGMAGRLLQYAVELLKDHGIITFLACSETNDSYLGDKNMQDHFLKALGFKEQIKDYHVLEYEAAALEHNKLRSFMNASSVHICALTPQLRRSLLRINDQIELRLLYYLSDETISPDSLVYLYGNTVQAAVILDERTNYRLCIQYIYLDSKVSDKTILLQLLASVISQNLSTRDMGNILIHAPEDRIRQLMTYFFGKPERQYDRTMYLLQ